MRQTRRERSYERKKEKLEILSEFRSCPASSLLERPWSPERGHAPLDPHRRSGHRSRRAPSSSDQCRRGPRRPHLRPLLLLLPPPLPHHPRALLPPPSSLPYNLRSFTTLASLVDYPGSLFLHVERSFLPSRLYVSCQSSDQVLRLEALLFKQSQVYDGGGGGDDDDDPTTAMLAPSSRTLPSRPAAVPRF